MILESAEIKCTRCSVTGRVTVADHTGARCSADSAARVAGWRIWAGETTSGAVAEHRLCPPCAGNATPEQEQAIAGWDAECHTCGGVMSEDWEDEGPTFTEAAAKEWTRDHDCEPVVSLIPPKAMAASA